MAATARAELATRAAKSTPWPVAMQVLGLLALLPHAGTMVVPRAPLLRPLAAATRSAGVSCAAAGSDRKSRKAKAHAQQHGQSAVWAVPQFGSCASSGLGTPRERPALWAPSHCLRLAASKVTLSSPLTIQAQQMKTMDAKLEGDASFFWQCVARHQSGGVISGISGLVPVKRDAAYLFGQAARCPPA